METNRIAVYTSIFGDYDSLKEPAYTPENCDFFIFTDQEIRPDSHWKVISAKYPDMINTNTMKNRYVKMMPHQLFDAYDYSIYIDGSVQITGDFTQVFEHINRKIGIAMVAHSARNCVYDEIDACIMMNKAPRKVLKDHKSYLESNGMPPKYGLVEGTVIIRAHHSPVCQKIMNDWWNEFLLHAKRDQLSLPYVLWKNQISITDITIPRKDFTENFFYVHPHKTQQLIDLMDFLPTVKGKVLEINCGGGTIAAYLGKDVEWWGVDPDPIHQKAASFNLHHFKLGTINSVNPDLPDKYFDLIIVRNTKALGVEILELLSTLKSKLSDDHSSLVCVIPNPFYFGNWKNDFQLLVNRVTGKKVNYSKVKQIRAKSAIYKKVARLHLNVKQCLGVRSDFNRKTARYQFFSRFIGTLLGQGVTFDKYMFLLVKEG